MKRSKIILVIVCTMLIFACSKNEQKQIAENNNINSGKKQIEKPVKKTIKAEKSESKKQTKPKQNKSKEKTLSNIKGLSPEIKSITVGNDDFGFVYTEDLTLDTLKNECPSAKNEKLGISMSTVIVNNGEGEFIVEDFYFEEMENAVFNNQEIPGYDFSEKGRLITIGEYKFIEFITVSTYSSDVIQLSIKLCTTTPTKKIISSFDSDINNLDEIIPVEAKMYFHDSGMTTDTEIEGWGNKAPAWNGNRDSDEYNRASFCEKLISGTCESKTAQEIFNQYQKLIKSMKIE